MGMIRKTCHEEQNFNFEKEQRHPNKTKEDKITFPFVYVS